MALANQISRHLKCAQPNHFLILLFRSRAKIYLGKNLNA